MGSAKKFSSVMDDRVWNELKSLSEKMKVDISSLLTEAAIDLIQKKKIRPGFDRLAGDLMDQFDSDLKKLAK
ncbi:MAG: ribbon-helix-helix domain-containing protein [Bdellovibrionales bacterium]|nr:ribbon-helix-helix domain-containing protein [Bdellovibrionales bacterium]